VTGAPVTVRATHSVTNSRFVLVTVLIAGLGTGAAGIGALLAPRQFAEFANFPYAGHFIHDAGAFQVGIAASLLLALRWRDSLVVVLAAFLAGNTIHTASHIVDLPQGGHPADAWGLGALSMVTAVALLVRVRQLKSRRSMKRVRNRASVK
jgi:hypothetical protein